ncbi:MAG: hypothetical protein ACI9TH_003272 [Kiritimatiellia bacterium]|jgi:uncharacterized protein
MKTNLHPKRTFFRIALLFFVSALVLPVSADELGELKESFKKRHPQLQAQKAAGKIGETSAGMTEAVNAAAAGDAAIKTLVAAENADRSSLYALLAKQEGVSAAVVAKRNGIRNFTKASAGEWLKDDKGWRQQ